MQFQTPTLASLTIAAWTAVRQRMELFFLLAGLSGILSAFLYLPAANVIDEILTILSTPTPDEDQQQAAAAAFSEGASTLFLGHLMVTAVATFLVIPWARASAPGNLVPSGGGVTALLRRGVRSFFHMVAASGLTIILLLVGIPLTAGLTASMGSLGNAVTMTVFVLTIWASIALTGTAHLAIAAEARDRQDTLLTAWRRARFFIIPIAGSLAFLVTMMILANMTVAPIILAILPDGLTKMVGLALSGSLLYMVSALHVAALYIVPDFRDLRSA